MPEGWICPKCGRVYAWWVSECAACNVPGVVTISSGTGCTCHHQTTTATTPTPCPIHGWVIIAGVVEEPR